MQNLFQRYVLCRLGRHGRQTLPDGCPANCCARCFEVLRPEAWLDWEVVLKDGTTFRVRAINEWHAGSEVVYGHGLGKIDGRTGEPIGEVVVHRDNIATVRLLHPGTDIVADAT